MVNYIGGGSRITLDRLQPTRGETIILKIRYMYVCMYVYRSDFARYIDLIFPIKICCTVNRINFYIIFIFTK